MFRKKQRAKTGFWAVILAAVFAFLLLNLAEVRSDLFGPVMLRPPERFR